MVSFHPMKTSKNDVFLVFSGGIERDQCTKWVKKPMCFKEVTFPDLHILK